MISKLWKLTFLLMIGLIVLAGCNQEPDLPVINFDPAQIKFAYFPEAADYEPLADQFNNESSTIEVVLSPFAFTSDFQTELLTQINNADVVRINPLYLPAETGDLFQSLEAYLYVDQEFPSSDFIPGSMQALKKDDEQIGIPAGLSPMLTYFAKEHFEDLNVEFPKMDWTLEDFLDTAKAVNRQDQADINTGYYRYGFCTDPDGNDAFILTYLFGGGIFSLQNGDFQPNFDDPANIEAVEWYASLFNDSKVTPKFSTAYMSNQFVAKDHCAMWFNWYGLLDQGEQQKHPGAVTLPSYRTDFDLILLDAYFIPVNAEHPDQAWEWIRFLIQQQLASGDQIPPLRSLWDSPDYKARVTADLIDVAKNFSPNSVILGYGMGGGDYLGDMIHEFNLAVKDVIRGSSSADEALQEAQMQAEKIYLKEQENRNDSTP